MRRAALGGIVALAMLGAPAPARACGQGSSYGGALVAIGIGAIAVASADIALTILDGSSMAQKRHRSIGYGVLEGLVAGPQFAVGIYGLTHTSPDTGTPYLVAYTVWMGLLTTHGIWTIVTAPSATSVPSDPVDPQPPSAAPPSDVTASPPPAEPLPRFQMSFGPTYVPLGQRAQPGFGVVGRF